jgi:hypothetical protein
MTITRGRFLEASSGAVAGLLAGCATTGEVPGPARETPRAVKLRPGEVADWGDLGHASA